MKDVSDQQVAEHLKRLNPWWQSGAMDDVTRGLRPRAYRGPVRQQTVDGCEIRQWPAAVLAFHYGMRAVQGRLAGFEAQLKEIT